MSTAAQTRAAGWYWVRPRRRWVIGEWCVDGDGTYWMLPGTEEGYGGDDLAEIDERRIERQEAMPIYKETQS